MTGRATWSCIQNCGACCKLSPDEREEAFSVLSAEDQKLFFSMVDVDGWCIQYNKNKRTCNIYSSRPSFCNIKSLIKLFNLIKLLILQKDGREEYILQVLL